MTDGASQVVDSALSGRQFVILSGAEAGGDGMPPVGARHEILDNLAGCNTAPDGDVDDVLFGPGIRIELAPGQDPVTQMLVTINEEEIGWLVLVRLIRKFGWKLLDPDTGRELNLDDAS